MSELRLTPKSKWPVRLFAFTTDDSVVMSMVMYEERPDGPGRGNCFDRDEARQIRDFLTGFIEQRD